MRAGGCAKLNAPCRRLCRPVLTVRSRDAKKPWQSRGRAGAGFHRVSCERWPPELHDCVQTLSRSRQHAIRTKHQRSPISTPVETLKDVCAHNDVMHRHMLDMAPWLSPLTKIASKENPDQYKKACDWPAYCVLALGFSDASATFEVEGARQEATWPCF